ncbi:MAG: MASE3 domain-containing protein, partial [Desulfitobacteriaceae bacterium]|nr:MASE3 domain-containing protein [Desulfitobacteriaceae bacterium]
LFFLGMAYLFIVIIDFFHLLTYKGMGVFPQFSGGDKATQFWVIGRMMEALTLVLAPTFVQRKLNWKQTAAAYSAGTLIILYILLQTNLFPACFIDGQGLTLFKITCEYLICLILIIAGLRFRKQKTLIGKNLYKFLLGSILFTILSEISFTVYVDVYGVMNFVGHAFKLVSYTLIYKGLIDLGIKHPYETIFFQLTNSLKEIADKNDELQREIEIGINHEKTIQQAYREIDQTFEAAADGMCLIDKNFNLLRINESFCSLLSMPKEKILGKKCYEVFRSPKCHTPGCGLINILDGNTRYEYTVEHEWQDGETTYGIVTTAPVYDSKGEVIGIVENFKDLTQNRRMERELQRLEKINMVGEIAVGLGHEIRNPLTTVRGFTQMLKKNYPQISPDYLDVMLDEIDRANMVISEFILLSQDKAVDKTRQNINDLVLNLKPLITAEAEKHSHFVTIDIAPIPEVLLDPEEIRQLIMHLARNGLEAMPKPGTLHIATYQENGHAVLTVSDQGPGIPSAVLRKIGTPFQSTKDFSLGLGLPVSYAIAQRHNGTINIDTKTTGTRIFVAFPSADSA